MYFGNHSYSKEDNCYVFISVGFILISLLEGLNLMNVICSRIVAIFTDIFDFCCFLSAIVPTKFDLRIDSRIAPLL